jgi:hypothetical protein
VDCYGRTEPSFYFVMRYTKPDQFRRDVYLCSPAPGLVSPGYYKILGAVKGSKDLALWRRAGLSNGKFPCSNQSSERRLVLITY